MKTEIIKPRDLVLGEELLHNHLDFGEPKITFDENIDKIYKKNHECSEKRNVY